MKIIVEKHEPNLFECIFYGDRKYLGRFVYEGIEFCSSAYHKTYREAYDTTIDHATFKLFEIEAVKGESIKSLTR